METTSPPMTPIRQYMSPLDTSPASSYREHLRRRTSSFSSNHDRSPTSIRKNRFSNASQLSNDFTPDGGGGNGMGNLADELDDLDDDFDADREGAGDSLVEAEDEEQQQPSPVDGARDSGIDVSYSTHKDAPRPRNFSKPFSPPKKPPEDEAGEEEEKLSRGLEDAMNNIARMASATSTLEDPLIPRALALLQDLGNQSNVEANSQRLTTSINSLTSHLTAQSKAIQVLAASLYSPFTIASPIDPSLVDETTPLVEALLKDLPLPDPAPLQGLQKLDRETNNVIHTLSQLTDTLQMDKQTTNSASRHLRTTQNMVAELRRERERAEAARLELSKTNWDDRLRDRWCAGECKDIVGGFERKCNALRESLEQACAAAA